jgi:hypothetical protein
MGEQVRVRAASEFGSPPRPAVPLQYAGPDASRLWKEKAAGIVMLLGGPHQIAFAVGLACVGAGLGEWDWFDGSGDAAGWFFFGGLFLGFAVPVPRRKV